MGHEGDQGAGRRRDPAVVGAVITTLGAILIAVVTVFGPRLWNGETADPAPPAQGQIAKKSRSPVRSELAVVTVSFHRTRDYLEVLVDGKAPKLGHGDRVFAVARSAAKVLAHRWFASDGVMPDGSGRWRATIIVAPPSDSQMTVSALLAPREIGPRASTAAKKARAHARAKDRRPQGPHPKASTTVPTTTTPTPTPTTTTPTTTGTTSTPSASPPTAALEVHGPKAAGVIRQSAPVSAAAGPG